MSVVTTKAVGVGSLRSAKMTTMGPASFTPRTATSSGAGKTGEKIVSHVESRPERGHDLAPGWFAWREPQARGPGRRGGRGSPLKSFEFRDIQGLPWRVSVTRPESRPGCGRGRRLGARSGCLARGRREALGGRRATRMARLPFWIFRIRAGDVAGVGGSERKTSGAIHSGQQLMAVRQF